MAVETTPKKILDKLSEILTSINGAIVPIGAVVSWLKSFTNTPSLPSGFVECNGQTLSDGDSVFNGQVIPNLNGDNKFLRGNSTSGGVGTAFNHIHVLDSSGSASGGSYSPVVIDANNFDFLRTVPGAFSESINQPLAKGVTKATNHLPPYYDVIWIMRVK